MAKKRIVITGAAGYVAQRMLDALRANRSRPARRVDKTRGGSAVPGLHVVDLTNEDRDRYRHLFRGADAVIHCAFTRPPLDGGWKDTSDVRFRAEYANIGMAYNVYRTALEEGVRRLLVCSSNHAADYYERLGWTTRSSSSPPRCRPGPTISTAGARRATSCSDSSSRPGRSTAASSRSSSGGSARRATTTWRRSRPATPRRCTAPWVIPVGAGSGAAGDPRDRDRADRGPEWRAIPRDLRHQRQYASILESRERAACARLSARG